MINKAFRSQIYSMSNGFFVGIFALEAACFYSLGVGILADDFLSQATEIKPAYAGFAEYAQASVSGMIGLLMVLNGICILSWFSRTPLVRQLRRDIRRGSRWIMKQIRSRRPNTRAAR